MSKEHLEQRLETVRQDAKHLCRLCLFAQAGGMSTKDAHNFCAGIQSRLGMNDLEFARAMASASDNWNQKIEEMDERLAHSALADDFEKRSDCENSPVSCQKARALLCQLLCLALQKASVQTGKNHLKQADLNWLEENLQPGGQLLIARKAIERPIRQVIKGLTTPTSEDFLLHIILRTQLLADYYQAVLEGMQGAKTDLILNVFKASKAWNSDQIRHFLSPDCPHKHLCIPASPLRGLETLITAPDSSALISVDPLERSSQ